MIVINAFVTGATIMNIINFLEIALKNYLQAVHYATS